MKRLISVLLVVVMFAGCATFAKPENIAAFASYVNATIAGALTLAQSGLALYEQAHAIQIAQNQAADDAAYRAERQRLADRIAAITVLAEGAAPIITAAMEGEATAEHWAQLRDLLQQALTYQTTLAKENVK